MVNRTFTHEIVDKVDNFAFLRLFRLLLMWINPPYLVENVENHII